VRRLAVIALAVLAFLSTGGIAHARATPRHGDFAGRVAISGGRSLFLMCRGTGRPTVLLEAGLRNRGGTCSSGTRRAA